MKCNWWATMSNHAHGQHQARVRFPYDLSGGTYRLESKHLVDCGRRGQEFVFYGAESDREIGKCLAFFPPKKGKTKNRQPQVEEDSYLRNRGWELHRIPSSVHMMRCGGPVHSVEAGTHMQL